MTWLSCPVLYLEYTSPSLPFSIYQYVMEIVSAHGDLGQICTAQGKQCGHNESAHVQLRAKMSR